MYTLLKSISQPSTYPSHIWTVEIKCIPDNNDIDPNIFVFHAHPEDDPLQTDHFSNVAALWDMNSLPVGDPIQIDNESGQEQIIPFYRKDTVTLDFHNVLEAERFWRIVQLDTKLLKESYKASNNLLQVDSVTI